MAHDPRTAASHLIDYNNSKHNPLTHIEVQKLLYLWHGWVLATTDSPLHELNWEAWRYGPVQPAVYYNLNHLQGRPITQSIPNFPNGQFTREETDALDTVLRRFRNLGPRGLVSLTHASDSPWAKIWRRRRGSMVIPNPLIRDYFAGLVNQPEQSHA